MNQLKDLVYGLKQISSLMGLYHYPEISLRYVSLLCVNRSPREHTNKGQIPYRNHYIYWLTGNYMYVCMDVCVHVCVCIHVCIYI
jgi:hypothetical protein